MTSPMVPYSTPDAGLRYDASQYGAGMRGPILWLLEQKFLGHEIRKLKSMVGPVSALDFACGTGRIAVYLEPLVEACTGVDVSEPMLARAREKLRGTSLIRADLVTDPHAVDGSYDLITAFRFVLNTAPDVREKALSCLSSKLRDKRSRLIFNVHGNTHSYRHFARLYHKMGLGAAGTTLFNEMSLRDAVSMARRCGLRVVKVIGLGFIPRTIARLLPTRAIIALESSLARLPLIWRIGTNLLFVCARAD